MASNDDAVSPPPILAGPILAGRVSAVVDLLLRRPPTLASARLVAVDGPAGSGKTTFAGSVEAEVRRRGLTVHTLHMDDLYDGWTGLDASLAPRVIEQILAPLKQAEQGRWQRYDWQLGRFADWHALTLPDVLLLEGCGSGDSSFASYTTVLVWVEASPDLRVERGLERDGEHVLEAWLGWMRLEQAHFARNDTADRADVHISTG